MSIAPNVVVKTSVANQFEFILGSTTLSRISSISGIAASIEVVEHKIGNDGVTYKRPGAASYDDITIKRPFWNDDTEFSDLWEKWSTATGSLEGGSIVLYNTGLSGKPEEVARWNFTEAFPSKYTLSDFDAGSSDLVTEELSFAITTLKRG